MEKWDRYIETIVISVIGGIIASAIYEIKGMDVFSLKYWVNTVVILVVVILIGFMGWRFMLWMDKNK